MLEERVASLAQVSRWLGLATGMVHQHYGRRQGFGIMDSGFPIGLRSNGSIRTLWHAYAPSWFCGLFAEISG